MGCMMTGAMPWVASSIIHVSRTADWHDVVQLVKPDNGGTILAGGAAAEPGAQQQFAASGFDLTGWHLELIVEPEFGFSTLITTFRSRSPTLAADAISVEDAPNGSIRFVALAERMAILPVGEWRYRLRCLDRLRTMNVARGPFLVYP